jgi:hypothetical protein
MFTLLNAEKKYNTSKLPTLVVRSEPGGSSIEQKLNYTTCGDTIINSGKHAYLNY